MQRLASYKPRSARVLAAKELRASNRTGAHITSQLNWKHTDDLGQVS